MNAMTGTLPVLCAALLACKSGGREDARAPEDAAGPSRAASPAALLEARWIVDTGAQSGLSGLAVDERGLPWAVPERGRYLMPLALADAAEVGALIPLAGVATGTDTEALAHLAPGRFALGTETQVPARAADEVLVVELSGAAAMVVKRLSLPYSLWGLSVESNRGIEGLCHAGRRLVAAVETVIESGGERWAPVARYDEAQGSWTPFRVRLSDDGGRLSSLACRALPGGEGLELLAIERDWGRARLLGFTMPLDGPGGDLAAAQLADLAALVPGRVPNMEGVEWTVAGGLMILVDNDTGGVTGPTELLFIEGGRLAKQPLSAPPRPAPSLGAVEAAERGEPGSP